MSLLERFKNEALNNSVISNFTSEWDEDRSIHTGKFEYRDKKITFIINEKNKLSAISMSVFARLELPEGLDELSLYKTANSINELMLAIKFTIDKISENNIYLTVSTDLVSVEIKDLSPIFTMLKILITAPAFFFNIPQED